MFSLRTYVVVNGFQGWCEVEIHAEFYTLFNSLLVFWGRYSTWRHHSIPDCLLAIEMLWNGCKSHVTRRVGWGCLFWHFEHVSLALLAQCLIQKKGENVSYSQGDTALAHCARLLALHASNRTFFSSLSVLGERSLSRHSSPGFHLKIHTCQRS